MLDNYSFGSILFKTKGKKQLVFISKVVLEINIYHSADSPNLYINAIIIVYISFIYLYWNSCVRIAV